MLFLCRGVGVEVLGFVSGFQSASCLGLHFHFDGGSVSYEIDKTSARKIFL